MSNKIEPKRDNKALIARLKKIEGQINGITKMIEENRACDEIIVQISAVCGALSSTAKIILDNHIDTCVLSGIKAGDDIQTVSSLKNVIEKFSRIK